MARYRPAQGETARVQVWDLPIRLFHWTLVVLLAFSWWSGEQHDMERHRLSGYAILALVVFRVLWGFVGGRTARFAHFVRGPRAALAYVRSMRGARGPSAPGHNPIGGWSVLLMLALVAGMVGAGVFAVDVDGLESGPLADFVSFEQGRAAASVHHFLFNLLLAAIALHVAAIAFYRLWLRYDLVSPMLHGRSDRHRDEGPLGAAWWKAVLALAMAVACATAVARGFRF
ncbi:cytochrome b/b6 domain-containing protein [Sphingomonas azotifigens]|uniref:cytochrome b/b6 domain-containing protein n=1 Tax=Sphingomonas azotifigens TaxID=330920 RepID=UPI000A063CA0|nr:cytochrome b/b6 domain-containing protein [Sphingomonas azotifigens]